MNSVKVLCVDDNPHVAQAIEAKLRKADGFQWLGHLFDAHELVSQARSRQPDIVLLDIGLPGDDPFTVLEEIGRTCPDVRVIIFSGAVERELIHRAIDAGAWGYVSKNTDSAQLLAAIKRVAEGGFALDDVDGSLP